MATATEVMEMRITRPLLLVRAIYPKGDQKYGSLFLPDVRYEPPRCATVERLGDGCPTDIGEGTMIWFGRYGATPAWSCGGIDNGLFGMAPEDADPAIHFVAPRDVQFYDAGSALAPANDFIFVERIDDDPTMSQGGLLHIPEIGRRPPRRGRVLAVGPGALGGPAGKRRPMEVAVGDEILYKYFSGVDVNDGERAFTVMREADVEMIVVGDDEGENS